MRENSSGVRKATIFSARLRAGTASYRTVVEDIADRREVSDAWRAREMSLVMSALLTPDAGERRTWVSASERRPSGDLSRVWRNNGASRATRDTHSRRARLVETPNDAFRVADTDKGVAIVCGIYIIDGSSSFTRSRYETYHVHTRHTSRMSRFRLRRACRVDDKRSTCPVLFPSRCVWYYSVTIIVSTICLSLFCLSQYNQNTRVLRGGQ